MRRGRKKKKETLSERRNWVKEVRERWRRKGSDHSLNRYSMGHTGRANQVLSQSHSTVFM